MPSEATRSFVEENSDLLADVLRYSQDSYARACALVLLRHGATERDLEAIQSDLALLDRRP
ncbi:MAG: hypothetical protein ABEJ55_05540 [Halanaeroarchaeum sp.]